MLEPDPQRAHRWIGHEAVALVDELAGPPDQLLARHPASVACPAISASRSARARADHGPGSPGPIGEPANRVTGNTPATLDEMKASSAAARSADVRRSSPDPQADAVAPSQQPGAGRAREDRAVERRRGQLHDPVRGPADEEDVGGRGLREVPVDGEEQGVVGAGPARLHPRVHVVRTRRGLEGRERVLRVAAHGRCDEVQASGQVVRRRRHDRPGLDRDGGVDGLVRREQAASADRSARDRDPDRGVAIRAAHALRGQEVGDAGRDQRVEIARQDDREAVGGSAEPGEMLRQLGGPAGAGAQGLEDAVAELEAAVEDREVGAIGGQQPAVDPHVPDAVGDRHATSTPPIAVSGPRALATVSSHSAPGSLR